MKGIKLARQLLRKYRFAWRNRDFEPHVTTLEVNGEVIRFEIADAVGKQWYEDTSPRDDPELRFICDRILQPGNFVVDCGSHHGLFTVFFARRVGPGGKVVAFEPSRAGAAVCRRNIELNGLTNAVVVEAAVSDHPGCVSTTGDSNLEILALPLASNTVETVMLDGYFSTAPDVVKIDIEGYEAHALRGMSQMLTTARPHLVIEVHADLLPNYGSTVDDVLAFADPQAYETWIQWEPSQEPEAWDRKRRITGRVHLFALSRARLERTA